MFQPNNFSLILSMCHQMFLVNKKCLRPVEQTKDFQAFRVGLVRRLTSAEFAFLFMVDSYSDNFKS